MNDVKTPSDHNTTSGDDTTTSPRLYVSVLIAKSEVALIGKAGLELVSPKSDQKYKGPT